MTEQARLLWIQRDKDLPLVTLEQLKDLAKRIDAGQTYARINNE
jgi:hypothetical protein